MFKLSVNANKTNLMFTNIDIDIEELHTRLAGSEEKHV